MFEQLCEVAHLRVRNVRAPGKRRQVLFLHWGVRERDVRQPSGRLFAEFAMHVIAPQRILSQLIVVALGFAVAYLFSALIRPVRNEIMSFKNLYRELRPSN